MRNRYARDTEEVRSTSSGRGRSALSGTPVSRSPKWLGIWVSTQGTLGNWVAKDRAEREGTQGLSTGDVAELKRLRAEVAELRMERDVLKRSVVLWVKEATK